MAKFKKKPVTIEASQWFKVGDHPKVSKKYSPDKYSPDNEDCGYCNGSMKEHGWISTLEGGHIVCPGDWIIEGVKGENYPCKPDIFLETYDPVTE